MIDHPAGQPDASGGTISLFDQRTWNRPITNEQAKGRIAADLAARVSPGETVGVGSGSTCFLTVQRIAGLPSSRLQGTTFVCTSIEMELLCTALGLTVGSLHNRTIDWHFDGADEINPRRQVIKGRGGAFFREKLLFTYARAVFLVADRSKFVPRLGMRHPLPIEVAVDAATHVANVLRQLGALQVMLRLAEGKDGPVVTESGNVILDTRWQTITASLNDKILVQSGIIDTGFFYRKDVQIISE